MFDNLNERPSFTSVALDDIDGHALRYVAGVVVDDAVCGVTNPYVTIGDQVLVTVTNYDHQVQAVAMSLDGRVVMTHLTSCGVRGPWHIFRGRDGKVAVPDCGPADELARVTAVVDEWHAIVGQIVVPEEGDDE